MAQGFFTQLRHAASYVVGAGLTLLFPPTCVGCGRLGELLCADCAQAVEPTPQPQCARCGLALPTATLRCAACVRTRDRSLHFTRSAALHSASMRDAIHAFKYERQPMLAPLLARYLVAVYAAPPWTTLSPPISAVVPVPLHEQRLADRGYNQSELLAASFGRAVELPVQPGWLARSRETRQQVGLGPRERQVNVDGAFTATPDVAGHRILLIDDVYTTGATLRACAAAALTAGAQAVYGLTLAQPVRQKQLPSSVVPNTEDDFPEHPWWESEL